jgi:butyryl-CoA dehydrogenase
MDYFLTEEQQMIKDLAGQIAREKIVPVRAELDEKSEFGREIMNVISQSDLMGVFLPEEYGGPRHIDVIRGQRPRNLPHIPLRLR